jgi:hypothetical protein
VSGRAIISLKSCIKYIRVYTDIPAAQYGSLARIEKVKRHKSQAQLAESQYRSAEISQKSIRNCSTRWPLAHNGR